MKLPGILLTLLLALGVARGAEKTPPPPPEWPAGSRDVVYFLPQFSEFESISESEMRFFRKTLERAGEARAKAVILELDTPGGSVETAFKYLSAMERSTVPIIVYLNPNGISAGMIIALGADRVAISPNGIIGDAMPIEMGVSGVRPVTDKPEEKSPAGAEKTPPPAKPEKDGGGNKKAPADDDKPLPGRDSDSHALDRILREMRRMKDDAGGGVSKADKKLADQKFLTVFFKMLQVLAEKNNRPVNVVRAMADPYMKLDAKNDGIAHDKVSPLTLSAQEARRLGVVDYVVRDRADLLRQLGLEDAELLEVRRTPTEQIGAFLASPAIAGLLLVIGLVGLFIEVKTPGFGVPGILGVSALTLFFLGHMASGASDWGPIVVFFVGLLLIGLEIFIIPGFGLVGILGIVCVMLSFFWAFGFSNIETALRVVTLALLAAIGIMVLLAVYVLPKTPLFRRVSLTTEVSAGAGFAASKADVSLVGMDGVALTPLRPAGVVKIDGARHDASSEGDFLEAGEAVVVTACNGFQVVVRRKNDV